MAKDRSYYDIQRNQSPPRIIKYFNLSEFDSPDDVDSGDNMDISFVRRLDEAREIAGIPFKVNSGYRTPFHNTMVGGVKDSSHIKIPCCAVDIEAKDSKTRFLIISSAIKVGINRIGIGKSFIHLDSDITKSQDVTWHYY
mgnify:FL=1|tara:strand:- start:248 stop:667 length:420 start_codon:yes stop_codon:yes gene_type:complete